MNLFESIPYPDIFPIIQSNLNANEAFTVSLVDKYCYENTIIKPQDKLNFVLNELCYKNKIMPKTCKVLFYNFSNEILLTFSSNKYIIHNQKFTNHIRVGNTNVPYDFWQNIHYSINDESKIMYCLKVVDCTQIASFKILMYPYDCDIYNKLNEKIGSIIYKK